ncbi:hypothetical protein IAR50_001720 [Cryptococcus sp. DSM 104548]
MSSSPFNQQSAMVAVAPMTTHVEPLTKERTESTSTLENLQSNIATVQAEITPRESLKDICPNPHLHPSRNLFPLLSSTVRELLSILKGGYGASYFDNEQRVARCLKAEIRDLQGMEKYKGFKHVTYQSIKGLRGALKKATDAGDKRHNY